LGVCNHRDGHTQFGRSPPWTIVSPNSFSKAIILTPVVRASSVTSRGACVTTMICERVAAGR
jgi:hypothetical protein